MPCFRPLQAWRSKTVNENGNRPLVFNRKDGYSDLEVQVPCGQCIGCRIDRSRMWALRCVHEAQLHEDNCFITLTYNDENLPADNSLNVKHWQLFMKRLRKKYGDGIRFFHCGEYGSQLGRPHYHACIFGFDFQDKTPWKREKDVVLYRSEALEKLWPYGYATVGEVTFQSAAYVARYILKKITGEAAKEHYEFPDQFGELHPIKPEYVTMSRRPGLGKGWFDLYLEDVYPHDYVVHDGKKHKVPRAYDNLFEAIDPNCMAKIKSKRVARAKEHSHNNTLKRLRDREEHKTLTVNLLKRGIES